MSRTFITLLSLAQIAAVSCWTWPNPRMERLDTLRFDQQGANVEALGVASGSCNNFIVSRHGNRTNVGDWLRTAYHDMATFNITDGTGGLDASIRFTEEQARSENAGDGFANTMTVLDISNLVGRWVSMADVIALSAVFSVEMCEGPQVDFRGGRVDATAPNKPGVPEPQQSLAEHTASFARQGFSATEMIQLIACGHTIGGVQNTAFPTIVPASTDLDDIDGHVTFDSTFTYDNRIATEYVAGTTRNPLVVGKNVTNRSDLRIFSSDNNSTIKALANNSTLFRSTCANLIGRMINTVPKGVTLTEVLVPLPAKPDLLTLVHNVNDGSLTLVGRARFWNLSADGTRTVNLVWAAQNATTKCSGCSITLVDNGDRSFAFAATKVVPFYSIPSAGAKIAASVGASPKFWFEVVEGGQTTVLNQNGVGFPLQTQVVLASTTCLFSDGSIRVDIAVRKGVTPSRVFVQGEVNTVNFDQRKPAGLGPTIVLASKNATASSKDTTHDIYSVKLDFNSAIDTGRFVNVAATVNGQDVADTTYFGTGFGSPYSAILGNC